MLSQLQRAAAAPADAAIDLSIIIVSWNVRDLLRACLTSIAETAGGLRVETIVVDSASHDGTPHMLATDFPAVTLLAQTANVGFARGNNLGLQAARGDYLLLLNPDTELRPGALQTLIGYLAAQPTVGLVGPQLFNSDGSHQSSRRRFPTLATALSESTWLQPYAPAGVLRHYYVQDSADDAVRDVDWVTGACMLTTRAVVARVGGFDEGYYMYSEELDWCRRIKAVGYRVVYLPQAHVLHHAGKSSEQAVVQRHINFNRAKLRYFHKYHGAGAGRVLRAALWLGYLHQLGLEAAKWAIGHRRALRRQRIAAYWRVLRSGLLPAGYTR